MVWDGKIVTPEAGKRRGAMGGQGWCWVGGAGSTCRHFCETPASRPGGETRRLCNTCPETGWYQQMFRQSGWDGRRPPPSQQTNAFSFDLIFVKHNTYY